MAVDNPTIAQVLSNISGTNDGMCGFTYTWTMANGDTANPAFVAGCADKSFQVAGSLGTGEVGLWGSNDGVNFFQLTTPAGVPAVTTSSTPAIFQIAESCLYVEPRITTSGITSATIVVFARNTQVNS